MPIDVLWEEMDWDANPSGPAPTRVLRIVRDEHSLVERLLSELPDGDFPNLKFISHETFTVFHQQHIAALLSELHALSRWKHDPDVAKQLADILQLVFEALGPKDTLIAFRARGGGDHPANKRLRRAVRGRKGAAG